jgi:nitrite reductase/ring-hydroxylating ferredoxin subunit
MSGFIAVARVEEIPAGTGRPFDVDGKTVALFNVGGAFYAMDGVCLHRGGPVGEGDLEETVVTCPWHGWQYDVTTGANLLDPSIGLTKHETRVENGMVLVALADD